MATKTISIDLEAYDRLCAVRKQEESFSQAIKRVIRKPISPDEWFAKIDSAGHLTDQEAELFHQSLGDKAPASFNVLSHGNSRQHRNRGPALPSKKAGTATRGSGAAQKNKRR
jgi:predicted CopG family antitoxin